MEREEEQRLFPNITFGCTGTVNKWIFAAEEKGNNFDQNSYPEVQIWDRAWSSDLFTKVQSSTLKLSRTDSLNVYEFLPVIPLPFTPGDVLGLYQPTSAESAFTVYSQKGAGGRNLRDLNENSPLNKFNGYLSSVQTNQRDLPLIAVEISKSFFHAMILKSILKFSSYPVYFSHSHAHSC